MDGQFFVVSPTCAWYTMDPKGRWGEVVIKPRRDLVVLLEPESSLGVINHSRW